MKKKLLKILKILLIISSIASSGYLAFNINKLDVLPDLYLILIIGFIVLLNIVSIIFIKSKRKALKVIGTILTILILVGSLVAVRVIKPITSFFDNSFNNNKEEITGYRIAVLKNSEYNELKDLDNTIMGYISLDSDIEKNMIDIKSNISIELKSFDSAYTTFDALTNKEIESMIIDEAFLDLLYDKYEDLDQRIKIIYSFEVKKQIETNDEDIKELKNISILISGSDSRSGDISEKTRSDVNMIFTVNFDTHTILLTSIPRDYYVQLHGTKGLKDKLTHAGMYGIKMTKTTIEDLLSIDIDYTVKVGFSSVIKIVDLIGGVDIESDTAFTSHCNDGGAIRTKVVKGMNHFNGGQALSYARERYAYIEGDNHRVQNQQQVLEAIINKMTSNKEILLNYDNLLTSFSDLYKTDLPASIIKLAVKEQLSNFTSWNIEKQRLTGSGASSETYSMPGYKLYVMNPDHDSVNEANAKINEILNKTKEDNSSE